MSHVEDGAVPAAEGPKPRHRPVKGPRTPMRENDPLERVAGFTEVGLGYNAEEAHAEAMRCLQCNNPLCIEGCPVHIDIKSFIGKIIENDECAGVEVLKSRNALPSACGRVCPQEEQCELACILHRTGQPIAIGRLERYLGDFDLAREPGDRCRPPQQVPSGKRCAAPLRKIRCGDSHRRWSWFGHFARRWPPKPNAILLRRLRPPSAAGATLPAHVRRACSRRISPTGFLQE